MAFRDFLFGSPSKKGQLSGYSEQNQEQFNSLISQLLGRLGGGQFDFGPIEQQARAGFEQKTVPSIAERFTSMGGGGGRSSAFGQQLGQAGSDLEQSLAGMRQNYGLQQQGLLQNLLGLGKQEAYYQPESPGFLGNIAAPLVQAGGSALGSYFGGPAGASAIQSLLQGLGQPAQRQPQQSFRGGMINNARSAGLSAMGGMQQNPMLAMLGSNYAGGI